VLPDRDDLAILALVREAALGRAFSPPIDVYSTEAKVVVTIELPGVAEDDVTVEVNEGGLSVRGRRSLVGAEGLDYYRLERVYGDFQCQVALPAGSRADRRSVSWADGVLTVVIPRGGA
jgi:HSP20 family protein